MEKRDLPNMPPVVRSIPLAILLYVAMQLLGALLYERELLTNGGISAFLTVSSLTAVFFSCMVAGWKWKGNRLLLGLGTGGGLLLLVCLIGLVGEEPLERIFGIVPIGFGALTGGIISGMMKKRPKNKVKWRK